MWSVAVTTRDRLREWWARYRAEGARVRWQDRQPATYSLISVQRNTMLAKWLAGLSGGVVVLAFAYYIQAYLSILSIKDDCASRLFVADAIKGAVLCAGMALAAGILALAAISWPAMIGMWRNRFAGRRRREDKPPLRPGDEFDGLSESLLSLSIPQGLLTFLSALVLFGLIFIVVFLAPPIKPEGVQKIWHKFELQCLPKSQPIPMIPGASKVGARFTRRAIKEPRRHGGSGLDWRTLAGIWGAGLSTLMFVSGLVQRPVLQLEPHRSRTKPATLVSLMPMTPVKLFMVSPAV
jgi:hypothetical protein